MAGYVDLHCHWVWQIDDGARSEDEGLEMLRRLQRLGFDHVVATPHMRPGMFDNEPEDLRRAYQVSQQVAATHSNLPHTSLGSEHFFDATVFDRIRTGRGLPYQDSPVDESGYRTSGAILVEFADLSPLQLIERQLYELQTAGFIPVVAHPERYRATWSDPSIVSRLVDLGSVALLDISALKGKYGRRSRSTAEKLLEDGVYDAACTDSHRPEDVTIAGRAMEWVEKRYGAEELQLLFDENPRRLMAGKRPQA